MIRKRVRTYRVGHKGNINGWHNSLVDVPAFIIGNAPSIEEEDLSILNNHFTIGINRIFYKFDPTILIWQDAELWWNHRSEINKLKAIKICRDIADPKGRFYHFKLTNGEYKIPYKASTLHGRGSTGPLAFQLAHIMGCNPIILVGMDCKYENGKTDFYGRNPSHKPHTIRNCRRGLSWIKKQKDRQIIVSSESEVFENAQNLESLVRALTIHNPLNRNVILKKLSVDKQF